MQTRPAADQQVADFVASQHDRTSANFHQWIRPSEFGSRFGVAQADIDRITGWLSSTGLRVNFVYPSRMTIDLSATAGQFQRAFHTEIHRYAVDGQLHIANASAPQIPAALAPAIAGFVSLNDFRATPRVLHRPRYTGPQAPNYPLTPADIATIYNFNPAFTQGITGNNMVIAVAEGSRLVQAVRRGDFPQRLPIVHSRGASNLYILASAQIRG